MLSYAYTGDSEIQVCCSVHTSVSPRCQKFPRFQRKVQITSDTRRCNRQNLRFSICWWRGKILNRCWVHGGLSIIYLYLQICWQEKFFGCDQTDEEGIVKKLNRLLGGDEKDPMLPRNPPWVQCCLFSFYRNKKDQWGSRRFRIFDTWINASCDI